MPAQLTTYSAWISPRSVEGYPALFDLDVCDDGFLEDGHTAHAGALGQGLGQVDRAGLAVAGHVVEGFEIIGRHQRPHALGLFGADAAHLDAELGGHGDGAVVLVGPVHGPGHQDRAVGPIAGRLTGLLLQLGVALGAVLGQAGQRRGGPQLADQASRGEGGAAGQGLSLQQNYVFPPQFGQMISNAAADDAAADDDRASLGREGFRHGSLLRI
jgi:hypothetical protein